MSLAIEQLSHQDWSVLNQKGCVNVDYKPLLERDHLALIMLRFAKQATIHEHPAEIDIDVICLQGSGFTSVGKEQSPIVAGERVRWPAGQPHRLWTTDDGMLTLMVEHTQSSKPIWEDVDSSMISAFKYNPSTKELDVVFKRTGIYRYLDVPQDVVDDLREASSKGSFMRNEIIDVFGYDKIGR